MKKINTLPIIIAGALMTSCNTDNEFSQIDSNIIGNPNYTTQFVDIPLEINNIKTQSVQTNSLSAYHLGQISQGDFGTTNASIVSQVLLTTANPTFGRYSQTKEEETGSYNEDEQVKNVYLYLPFFSKSTTENNQKKYTLDSIFGSQTAQFDISVDELDYHLRNVNTNFEPQVYFSDQNTPKGEALAQNIRTNITNAEIIRYQFDDPTTADDESKKEKERLAPGIRIELTNKAFFQRYLLDNEGKATLSNNVEFVKAVKGIIISTANFSQETLALINLTNAKIEVDYTYNYKHTDGVMHRKTDTASLTLVTQTTDRNGNVAARYGIAFNTFTNSGANISLSPDHIFLNGAGHIAEFSLNNQKIQKLVNQKVLINQAQILFYVDESKVGSQKIPQYLMLYNAQNSTSLADYTNDININKTDTSIEKVKKDNNGTYYKIRLNDHLTNIVKGNTENVKIGLVASLNKSDWGFNAAKYKNQASEERNTILGNSENLLSVVLYSNSNNTPEAKKPVLRVWYSVSK